MGRRGHGRLPVSERWAHAFRRAIKQRTDADEFTYITAVTRLYKPNERALRELHEPFRTTLGCEIRVITLSEMVDHVSVSLTETAATPEL